jgi:hypothetical protein
MESFIYVILFFGGIFGVIKFIIWYGKRNSRLAEQELTYDIMYLNLKTIIDAWKVTENNYNQIQDYFLEMIKLPHKNREKTTILYMEFLNRWKLVTKEKLSQDEFSAREVLGDNYGCAK